MRTLATKFSLGASILLAGGLGLMGGPLQRADLAAAPTWAVHIDFDGLRQSTLGKFVMSELEKPEAQAKFEVFQSLFSFDLRTQLHGVTLYGTGTTPEDGVVLVYADFNKDKLVTLAKAAKDYKDSDHNSHVIHSWADGKHRHSDDEAGRSYGANYGSRLVIFGRRESTVAAALDVLDNVSQNMNSSKAFPQLGSTSDGSFIQAAAGKLTLPGADAHAAVFKLAKVMSFRAGETDHQVNATLTLDAQDDEVAEHMAGVGQGLVSLLKLNKDKPELAKLVNALTLKQDGTAVVAKISLAADDVVTFFKSAQAKKATAEKD